MGLATEMKELSKNILFSFNQRIKENEELVNDVQNTLDQFQKDHKEMTAVLTANAKTLRKDLATGEKERINNYNTLMAGIQDTIGTIKTEVVAIQTSTLNMINEFGVERTQMASELDKFFAQGRADRKEDEKTRMAEFDALMKDINDDIKIINDEVVCIFKSTNDMLKNFNKEHQNMSVELRADMSLNLAENVEYTRTLLNSFQKRLSEISKENQKMAQKLQKDLAKGEVERLNDYNGIMKGIHTAIKGLKKEVMDLQKASSVLISNYAQDRSQGSIEWNNMQDTIAQLKKTGVVEPVIEIATKPKKQDVKIENLIEAVTENPVKKDSTFAPVTQETEVEAVEEIHVEFQSKEEPKSIDPVSLEDRVFDYINQHHSGVRISEMEGPLGETRMKLGFTAKVLLEEGKVQKIENTYYPLK
jgi:uncharacterized membrane-anchored protein YhcB (DUF1043 family)